MSTVVVTGSAGRIGQTVLAGLPDYGWDVRGFDRRPAENTVVGELADAEALAAVLDGADAVVHLAGQPTEAPWPTIRDANVDGLLNLFEAARRAGVPRVVYASSNHATGFTPNRADLPVDEPPRPDTLYGVSKVFGEALGRYYCDRYGMRVACLRIGTFAPQPRDHRALATWLSPGDCVRLVDACLRAPELTYAVLWGVSANTRRTWSLEEAVALGYEPRDDAEVYAAELDHSATDPSDGLVGGGYTGPGFGIDEVAERHSGSEK